MVMMMMMIKNHTTVSQFLRWFGQVYKSYFQLRLLHESFTSSGGTDGQKSLVTVVFRPRSKSSKMQINSLHRDMADKGARLGARADPDKTSCSD